jgi:hypothetical protein
VVPGSATLTYDVELLSVEAEEELWDMGFEAKMKLASERRSRGNTLVGGGHLLMASEEYEQALRYLVFMPHPEEAHKPLIAEAITAVRLNLAAARLRMGDEARAIKAASEALGTCADGSEGAAYRSKAHYRLAQAHTQLGKYKLAAHHLSKAEEAAAGDAASVAAIRKEGERLQRRQEKHARDRKRAAARMVQGGGDESGEDGGGEPRAGGVLAWLKQIVAPKGEAQTAEQRLFFFMSAVVLMLAIIVALVFMWIGRARIGPKAGTI